MLYRQAELCAALYRCWKKQCPHCSSGRDYQGLYPFMKRSKALHEKNSPAPWHQGTGELMEEAINSLVMMDVNDLF